VKGKYALILGEDGDYKKVDDLLGLMDLGSYEIPEGTGGGWTQSQIC